MIVVGDSEAKKAVFGIPPTLLPFRMPPTAIRYKIRLRNNGFGRVFVKYPDRIEHCYLGSDNGEFYAMWPVGINKRK